MLLRSWIRSVVAPLAARSIGSARHQKAQRQRRIAPQTEGLEARQLLTVLTTDQTPFVDPYQDSIAHGARRHLVIRENLLDKQLSADGDFSDAAIRALMTQVSDFHQRQSFGQISFPDNLLTIYPDTVTINYTEAQIESASTAGAPSSASSALHDSATAIVAAAGVDLSQFDHITVIHPSLG